MAIILQRTELTCKKKTLLFSRLAVTRAMLITALTRCQGVFFTLTISLTPNFLYGPAGGELHALRNNIRTRVFDQKVNVVGRDHIIEHAQTKAFLGFENPMKISVPITVSETIETIGTAGTSGTI
jgi:hypothetical protein